MFDSKPKSVKFNNVYLHDINSNFPTHLKVKIEYLGRRQ